MLTRIRGNRRAFSAIRFTVRTVVYSAIWVSIGIIVHLMAHDVGPGKHTSVLAIVAGGIIWGIFMAGAALLTDDFKDWLKPIRRSKGKNPKES